MLRTDYTGDGNTLLIAAHEAYSPRLCGLSLAYFLLPPGIRYYPI